ncbi:MAG: TatD family deoxyribonuclease [Clostridia bacterium]|nr:TatD family hydrolase [Lachnospiraceae bacterium]NCB99400.1 TatD family deoxyribonuclease [Clostridia bacterium]NCD01497.1 TatD family deoxyribonuclease [Clostridia bacterium]
MIFDTHAHYDDKQFNKDREELFVRLKEAGIGRVVDIGADIESTRRAVELAKAYDFIYAAAGVHPSDVDCLNEESFKWLTGLVEESVEKKGKIVAVGEIGLDYYWEKDVERRNKQKYWFEQQMELARKVELPVVIHSREAAKDTWDMMDGLKCEDIGGVVHCYSYSVEMAKNYLNKGFYMGIGGVVTYKNARVLKEVVQYAPMDRIVLETDCPYLTPEPNRGKRNSSLNLPYVVKMISELKGLSEEEVEAVTWENGRKMYRMSE